MAEDITCHSPPDVQNNSRIIGLLGITDYKGAAAPQEDGWFVSDFYLFNSLVAGMGKTQAWFTCLDPKYLINSRGYGEYAHGNPYAERRVVLDRHQQPDQSTLKVVAPDALLPAFLAYLASECQDASLANDPVLVFIFGHGDKACSGVEIGRLPSGRIPLLEMETFRRMTGSDAEVCTVMTSCYSGGWAVNPNLNVTTMTAAGPDCVSESWNASLSVGRHSGSIFASAVLRTLLGEDATLETVSKITGEDFTAVYREFCTAVEFVLLNKVDRYGQVHQIQFSAQHDLWEMEWRRRTGYPLAAFKERWERLRLLPRQEAGLANRDPSVRLEELPPAAGQTVSRSVQYGSIHGQYGGSLSSLTRYMQHMAQQYLDANPGRDTLASNHRVHRLARACTKGTLTDFEPLAELHQSLEYRNSLMNLANTYARLMGLSGVPLIHNFDEFAFRREICMSSARPLFHDIWRRVVDLKLFPEPLEGHGRSWDKPEVYLAAVCTMGGSKWDEIQRRLEMVSLWRYGLVEGLSKQLNKVEMVETKRRRWRDTLKQTMGSLSPRKRSRRNKTELA